MFLLKPSRLKESIDSHKFLEMEAAEDWLEEEVDAEGPGITTGVVERGIVPMRVGDPEDDSWQAFT